MSPEKLFTEHPQSVGETYCEHMGNASYFGFRMVLAGLACLVHAVLPFLFVRTGSQVIEELHARMSARRSRSVAHPEGTHSPALKADSTHRPAPRTHRHRIAT